MFRTSTTMGDSKFYRQPTSIPISEYSLIHSRKTIDPIPSHRLYHKRVDSTVSAVVFPNIRSQKFLMLLGQVQMLSLGFPSGAVEMN